MKNKPTPNRAGLSLMEVLAAIFVLSFGLLGVLSVVPYGMYQVERAGIANHGGNCLRGIEQEISIRKWNTTDLFDLAPPPLPNRLKSVAMNGGNIVLPGGIIDCSKPIIVDPLFDVRLNADVGSPFDIFAYHATLIPDITLTPPQQKEHFQNIFLWQEDVDFKKVPDGGDTFFTTSSEETITSPSAGKYSWFFVVNIKPGELDYIDNTAPVMNRNMILASNIGTDPQDAEVRVAVCYNRSPGDTLCEGNFTVDTSITPTSTGGLVTLSDLPDEFDTSDTRYMLLITKNITAPDARRLPHWYQIIYRNDNQFMLTGEKPLNEFAVIERAILIRGVIYVSKKDTIQWSAN